MPSSSPDHADLIHDHINEVSNLVHVDEHQCNPKSINAKECKDNNIEVKPKPEQELGDSGKCTPPAASASRSSAEDTAQHDHMEAKDMTMTAMLKNITSSLRNTSMGRFLSWL